MNEVGPSLVTTYAFKSGKEYVVKIKVTAFKECHRNLELTVTDKYTGENWRSSYDAAYIENLTHKTGNYKHFDVFVAMLQSGLLKTSESITLDLLTFEDLELLRARRLERNSCSSLGNATNNRRYLILTYTVEFDRIHYPLPLEYCGLPDPVILQSTIRRLQVEIERLQSTGGNKNLQRRIEQLTAANQRLVQENQRLTSGGKGLRHLLGSIKSLENNVAKERASFRTQIQKLKAENAALLLKVQQLTESAGRKPGDGSPALKRYNRSPSIRSNCSNSRQSRSRSSSISSRIKTSRSSLSPGSSMESLRIRRSPCRNMKLYNKTKDSKLDLENLESRIHTLQKMLKEGINLN
ncbi:centrosomal protein CCDC61-like [Hylaeus anthracinus]|uniref:centrosomal protein CCDC61-like n=1 Tax=Hylaeus volcanicus TaxID=313075 RepID=UPI0023B82866|nr:centrosomal protein CCDC61-like [Hylaeus volcanicus]XP_054012035.1 centrosomal protein CCDC61-like [Hylaeus anthracinus]